MATQKSHASAVRLCWIALGAMGAGCLDPLIEDPGYAGSDEANEVPIPVGPDDAQAGGVSGPAGSTTEVPSVAVAPTAGSSSAAPTATATAPPPLGSGNSGQPAGEIPGQGASGAASSEPDAGALEESDGGDAGSDAGASAETYSTATASTASSFGFVEQRRSRTSTW